MLDTVTLVTGSNRDALSLAAQCNDPVSVLLCRAGSDPEPWRHLLTNVVTLDDEPLPQARDVHVAARTMLDLARPGSMVVIDDAWVIANPAVGGADQTEATYRHVADALRRDVEVVLSTDDPDDLGTYLDVDEF